MNFSRGYDPVREKVSKGSKYTMSCYNCEYFYQEIGDDCEMCQNPNVIKYDMVVTTNNIYCNKWKMSKRQPKEPTVFKRGVNVSGRKKKKFKKSGK